MPDLVKLMNEIFENNPELKKMKDADDKWMEERCQHYLNLGLNDNDARVKSWNDYWKMANDRDGVEFSIREIK